MHATHAGSKIAPTLDGKTVLDREASRRIWITRYLMVIGLVVLHVPPYRSLGELAFSPFDLAKGFFSHGLFRATVPVLTALSGYLVFHFGLEKRTRALIGKKIKTLLVPLILWNLPLAVGLYFAQRNHLLGQFYSAELYPFSAVNWLNAISGLSAPPINYPLNFLRDLFVIALLAPLFGFALKRMPYTGLMLVGIVYAFNLDGPLVLRNTMFISFYIGGLAAVRKWDLTRLDPYAGPLAIALVLTCMAIVAFDIENRDFFRIISPFLVWPAISLIARTPVGDFLYQYSDASFFTFLSHGPLLLMLWLAFQQWHFGLAYPFFWVLAPLIAVAFGVVGSRLLKRVSPNLASILLGGR